MEMLWTLRFSHSSCHSQEPPDCVPAGGGPGSKGQAAAGPWARDTLVTSSLHACVFQVQHMTGAAHGWSALLDAINDAGAPAHMEPTPSPRIACQHAHSSQHQVPSYGRCLGGRSVTCCSLQQDAGVCCCVTKDAGLVADRLMQA
jgi:hypothetical protein